MAHKFNLPPEGAVLFTVNETCALSRKGRNFIYNAINAGALKTVKVGRNTFIPASAAAEWLRGFGVEVRHASA